MLYLQEMAKKGPQKAQVELEERLPDFLKPPCHLDVDFQVEAKDNFYLITLHAQGQLKIQCQRCLDEFDFTYNNQTLLAVCKSEKQAEELLKNYECIVSSNVQIDLKDILIDELYLYAPQFHVIMDECNSEINQFLTGQSEFY